MGKFVDEFVLGYLRVFKYIEFKMKRLSFVLLGVVVCGMRVLGEWGDVLLEKVGDGLWGGKEDYGVSVLGEGGDGDGGEREMLYWRRVGKGSEGGGGVGEEVGVW